MENKKAFLPTMALLIALIICISAAALFSHNNKDTLTNMDRISKQKAYEKKVAETLVIAIKYYDNVDDVIINTETNPRQVNIITKATCFLTPEAKKHIEKLISDVYPETTVNYSSD